MITRRALFSLDFDRPPRAAGALLRVHRTAMACRVEVALAEQDGRDVAAARTALDEADRVERLLTVFRESSELSRINREASEGAAAVDAEVYALLRRCRQLHAATGGAFDITSTPLSRCWGFLKRQGQVPLDADIETARALVGMRRVDFDDEARSIRFARAGMQLNLNAVGKGYALDRMALVLRKGGIRHALLSAGGSSVVAVGGRRGGWPIDIRSPLVSRSHIARLRLLGGALGTSGPGEQFVIAEGTRYGHVIDPRTRPAGARRAERERRGRGRRDCRRAVDGILRRRLRARGVVLRRASRHARAADARRRAPDHAQIRSIRRMRRCGTENLRNLRTSEPAGVGPALRDHVVVSLSNSADRSSFDRLRTSEKA